MQWQELVEFLGGATAISITIGFLGKKAIESYVAGRVEAYKSNLEKIAIEHSIRFQKLHTERAQSIKELYEKIVDLDLSLNATLKLFHHTGEPSLDEKMKELSKKHNELYYFYLPKKIFFDKKMCAILDKIIENSKDVFIDITTYPVDPQNFEYKYKPELLQERHEFWEKARDTYFKEINCLKEELEAEFRNILGIEA